MIRLIFDTKVDVLQVDVVPELLPITWTLLALRLCICNSAHRVRSTNNKP